MACKGQCPLDDTIQRYDIDTPAELAFNRGVYGPNTATLLRPGDIVLVVRGVGWK